MTTTTTTTTHRRGNYNAAIAAYLQRREIQARMLALYVDGQTVASIAAALGIAGCTCSIWLRRLTDDYERRAPGQFVSRQAARAALAELRRELLEPVSA